MKNVHKKRTEIFTFQIKNLFYLSMDLIKLHVTPVILLFDTIVMEFLTHIKYSDTFEEVGCQHLIAHSHKNEKNTYLAYRCHRFIQQYFEYVNLMVSTEASW